MDKPRVGLLIFSESLVREDVYRKRKPISDREVERLVGGLAGQVELIRTEYPELRSKRQALEAMHYLAAQRAELALLYVPIFVSPALVAHTANLLDLPLAAACNEAPDSLSRLAFLASCGAMDQIGLEYLRMPGDATSEANLRMFLSSDLLTCPSKKLSAFSQIVGSATANRSRRSVPGKLVSVWFNVLHTRAMALDRWGELSGARISRNSCPFGSMVAELRRAV
ncbi:MAG: hypothetical protein HXY20_15740 [Acidobacteria bacterium]|nr:hypothetical protein [Acidobacteriota bacterium]